MFYEVHVTVDSTDVERWEKLCANLGIKPLLIELACGTYRRQLMCAALHNGTGHTARRYADWLVESVHEAGFEILRVKLEQPLTDAQPGDIIAYLETHLKLLLVNEEIPLLNQLAGNDLYISRSLLGSTSNRSKWYLTQRTYGIDPKQSELIFKATLSAIGTRLPIVKMEMEAVIFDTNPAVDSGWAA
jgi:hypothetical protein